MSKALEYELAQLPAMELAGVFVSTNMEKAMEDAMPLWEKTFMPLAAPLWEKLQPKATYGLSFVTSEDFQSFNYWAALPWTEANIPDGMKKTAIPAGTYLKCTVPSLQDLGDVYNKIGEHIMADPHLDFAMGAPSIEEYPAAFPNPPHLYLYMPVKKV